MTIPAAFRTHVHKLRVRTSDRYCASAVANALVAVDLHPAGLPQSAILIMRRLRVQRALSLTANGRASPPSVDWRDAARGLVSDRLRSAVRPIFGVVPAACEAVLFADVAELLVCLARDWLDGAVNRQWWWRDMFRHTELDQVVEAWLESPTALPAAFALLESEGRAREFVRNLPEHHAVRLFAALATVVPQESVHFPVLRISAANKSAVHLFAGIPENTDVADAACIDAADFNPGSIAAGDHDAIQARLVDASSAALTLKHKNGEDIVDGLPERDASAVSASLPMPAEQVPDASPIRSKPRIVMTTVEQLSPLPSSCVAASAADAAALVSPASSLFAHDFQALTPAGSTSSVEAGLTAGARHTGVDELSVSSESGNMPIAAFTSDRDADPSGARPAITASKPTPEIPEIRTARKVRGIGGETIDTAFGGLFYLINVSLFTGLYGDFTQPQHRGIALAPWDFLALIGERWFGAALREDPLWTLLWQLAGHESDADIGAGFTPAADWRLPPEWLQPFPLPGSIVAQRAGRRARLRHPAGFTIREEGVDSSIHLAQRFEEWKKSYPALEAVPLQMAPWRPPHRRVTAADSRPLRAELRGWLDAIVPYFEARLALALGERCRADVPARLCAHAARITLTPAHVEIGLSLDTLPLAIRYAGLDRDPGWVPAAGRTFRFHFD